MKHDANDPLVSSPQEIAALISRYRASDLGLERFAQKHRIPTGRLRYWLYQSTGSPIQALWPSLREWLWRRCSRR